MGVRCFATEILPGGVTSLGIQLEVMRRIKLRLSLRGMLSFEAIEAQLETSANKTKFRMLCNEHY